MENNIQCPHCKFNHYDWWEFIDFEEDEQEFEMDCESCAEKFKVSMYTTRTFTTQVK